MNAHALPNQRLSHAAALLMIAAGVIHLALLPAHWAHAPAHGLFFALAGLLQIAWGIAVWRRPSIGLDYAGIVLAGGLLVLWGITRVLPAPFGHGPEEMEIWGLLCKLAEALAAAALVVLVFRNTATRAGQPAAWRVLGLLLLAAFAIGLLTYGVARAAEPLLPGLRVAEEHHHDSEGASEPGHHDESTDAGELEHDHEAP
jgi:hypothetical protein